jgi:hypothetical protein
MIMLVKSLSWALQHPSSPFCPLVKLTEVLEPGFLLCKEVLVCSRTGGREVTVKTAIEKPIGNEDSVPSNQVIGALGIFD